MTGGRVTRALPSPLSIRLTKRISSAAEFETYSILTRLPLPLRLSASQAATVLAATFPEDCWLDAAATRDSSPDFSWFVACGGV